MPVEKGDALLSWRLLAELDLFSVTFANAIRLVCGALIFVFIFCGMRPWRELSPMEGADDLLRRLAV
jgi:hypothetical protein